MQNTVQIATLAPCGKIDISNRIQPIDFDSLVPISENPVSVQEYQETEKEIDSLFTEGMDVMPEEIFNSMIDSLCAKGKYRDVFLLVAHANFGLRNSDVRLLRKIDLIDQNGHIRDLTAVREKKTSKPRLIYTNNAVKMALLMLLWHGDFNDLDYLVYSEGKRKGYEMETYTDENGKEKAVRKNGKYVYKLDENGNKIPKPLSRIQEERIIKDCLINDCGIELKNDSRCNGGTEKYNTHSLRKLHLEKFGEKVMEIYGSEQIAANTALLEIMRTYYNHTSAECTARYSGIARKIFSEVCPKLNIGLEVLEKYFSTEKEKYLLLRK
jgi:hypothetical protein